MNTTQDPSVSSAEITVTPINKPSRNFNLDLMRIIALCCVPITHFFLHTGFYSHNVDSIHMAVSLCLRNFGLLCIPLFMLLTGYLQGNKNMPPTLKYYTKILKFIVPHILIILFTIVFNHFYHGKNYTLGSFINELISFPGYSWYVEMYIGLFLMIPFLNMLWSNLKSRRQEHVLLGILIFLSLLPTIVNTFYVGQDNFWTVGDGSYFRIIPNFWTLLYPITHYYAGAYLCKHKDDIKIKPVSCFLLFICSFALFAVYNISRNIGAPPSVYGWVGRNSFGQFLVSTTLLLFISSINFRRVPSPIAKFTAKLSDLSFGAYLASYIVDVTLYAKLNHRIPTFYERLWYFPLMVLLVVVSSLIISFFIDLISKPIIRITEKLIMKLTTKKATTEI